VSFVGRSADPATRTFRVDVRVPNPDLTLRDGETAEIGITADGRMAHLVPQSALTLDDAGTLGVRTVDADRTARFAPVTLLRDTPTGIWLTDLPERADIIVIGQEYVTDGVPVEPVYQELGQ
jgi:multidrug efflux system membrane fusion protein